MIDLSEKSKSFLNTSEIKLNKDEKMATALKENDDVFLKFHDIDIEKNYLRFKTVELYRYLSKIEKTDLKNESFIIPNDFGGYLIMSRRDFYI